MMTTTTGTAASFTAGTAYQVTDDRLFRVRGGDYATLTPGTHVLVYGPSPTGSVVEALNTRTGRRVLILNEAAYVACFREIGSTYGPDPDADEYDDDDDL